MKTFVFVLLMILKFINRYIMIKNFYSELIGNKLAQSKSLRHFSIIIGKSCTDCLFFLILTSCSLNRNTLVEYSYSNYSVNAQNSSLLQWANAIMENISITYFGIVYLCIDNVFT